LLCDGFRTGRPERRTSFHLTDTIKRIVLGSRDDDTTTVKQTLRKGRPVSTRMMASFDCHWIMARRLRSRSRGIRAQGLTGMGDCAEIIKAFR
jgi:hypothetical protein